MTYLPPTIAPADDDVPVYQSTPVETYAPAEPEVQYVEEPQIEYVEQPQIEYVEQPQMKQFYPLNDPFFNWNKGAAGPNWRVYNPEDKMNLAVYEGDMLNGMRHGFGRLTTPKYVRLGMWRDDQFTGWGRESRRNGDVLEGKYIDGRVTGKGILKNAKGNLYVGDFVESRRQEVLFILK